MDEFGGEINTGDNEPKFLDFTPPPSLWDNPGGNTFYNPGNTWGPMPTGGQQSTAPYVPGFNIQAPNTDSSVFGDRPYAPLPFSISTSPTEDLQFKTDFNYANPASSYDVLAGLAQKFIPGVRDLGNTFGSWGTNLANSDFGKAISNSPFATAAGFAGSVVDSVLKGSAYAIGDILEPFGAAILSAQNGDLGGFVGSLLRSPFGLPNGLYQKGASWLNGDEQAKTQLLDEVGAISLVLGPWAGARVGITKALGESFAGQAAGKAGSQIAKVYGAGATQAAITGAKWTMAMGYGAEVGLDVAGRFNPDAKALGQEIASNRLVPEDSPFRGMFDLGAAGLADPFPMLGRLADDRRTLELLNQHKVASPTQGHFGMGVPKLVSDYATAHEINTMAVNDVIEAGNVRVGSANFRGAVNDRIDEYIAMRDGEAGSALNMVYHNNLYEEHYYEAKDTASKSLDMNTASMTYDQWLSHQQRSIDAATLVQAEDRARGVVDPLNNPVHVITRDATHVTGDVDRIMQLIRDVFAPGTTGKLGAISLPVKNGYALFKEKGIIKAIEDAGFSMGKDIQATSPKGIVNALNKLRSEMPKELDGPVADRVRALGYKAIELGGQTPKTMGDMMGNQWSRVRRDAERVWQASGNDRTVGALFGSKTTKGLLNEKSTLQDAADLFLKNHLDDRSIKVWTKESTLYTKDGVTRPWFNHDPGLQDRMVEASKVGNFVAAFRGLMPNKLMGYAWQEKFYNTFLERIPGATRDLIDKFNNRVTEEMTLNSKTSRFQMPQQVLQKIGEQTFGKGVKGADGKMINFGQLLTQTTVNENLKQSLKAMVGAEVGKAGWGPSFFSYLRGANGGRIGDAYRYWTQVIHPTLRYDWSPVFQIQLPFENALYEWGRGIRWDPLATEYNEAMSKAAPELYRQMKSNAADFEHPSGMTMKEKQFEMQSRYAQRQLASEFPRIFQEVFKKEHPEDFALLAKTYGTNDPRAMAKAIMGNKEAIRKYNAGELGWDAIKSRAGLTPEEKAYAWMKHSMGDNTELMPTLSVHQYGDFPRSGTPTGGMSELRAAYKSPDATKAVLREADRLKTSGEGKDYVYRGVREKYIADLQTTGMKPTPSVFKNPAPPPEENLKLYVTDDPKTAAMYNQALTRVRRSDLPKEANLGDLWGTGNKGLQGNFTIPPEKIEIFDPRSKTWVPVTDIPTAYDAAKAVMLKDGFQAPLVMHYHSGTGEAVIADADRRLQMAHELSTEGHSEFEYVPVTIRNENSYIERLKADGVSVKTIPHEQLLPGKVGAGTSLMDLPANFKPSELFKNFRPKEADDVIAAFRPIATAAEDALKLAVQQAQTTQIFNPARSYMEKSLSHPMLMYPLSWTLRASSEWARFITHSAFGLPTGMAGLVAWNDVQNATAKALSADPAAQSWMREHPETLKLINFLMPGTPMGLGFGLISTPARELIQAGFDVANGQPVNFGRSLRFGLIRDLDIGNQMRSEWLAAQPKSALTNAKGKLLNP